MKLKYYNNRSYIGTKIKSDIIQHAYDWELFISLSGLIRNSKLNYKVIGVDEV